MGLGKVVMVLVGNENVAVALTTESPREFLAKRT